MSVALAVTMIGYIIAVLQWQSLPSGEITSHSCLWLPADAMVDLTRGEATSPFARRVVFPHQWPQRVPVLIVHICACSLLVVGLMRRTDRTSRTGGTGRRPLLATGRAIMGGVVASGLVATIATALVRSFWVPWIAWSPAGKQVRILGGDYREYLFAGLGWHPTFPALLLALIASLVTAWLLTRYRPRLPRFARARIAART